MADEALVHLRIPAATKAAWVRASRAAGMRLTDWIVARVERALEPSVPTPITIPAGLSFADLNLGRDPVSGDMSFSPAAVSQIEQASGLPEGFFMGQPEDALAALIVQWYASHRADGGQADPVAEDLIAEARLEGERGVTVSHAPGRA